MVIPRRRILTPGGSTYSLHLRASLAVLEWLLGEPKMTNLDKVMNPLVIAAALVAYFAFRVRRLAWFAAKLHIAPKSWNRWIFGRDYDQKPR